ncbi:UNVERIFIED_CONTAM: CRM-domain containing factor CFM2, chloroplastic [Sesamum radiatum]|uniref:CRM-domain containing factor CFM2, chloroplastic n=1 Tax=Sesamum radiatum TaxID=300843 RepID=A0AAW2RB70_SESRA
MSKSRHTLDPSWSTPENPIPDPGSGNAIQRFHELRRGVLEEEEKERIRKRREGTKESAPSLAELTLPKDELRRLRSIGIGLKKKLKVGKAGITEGIVNGIHERWRRSELVKITCEDICRLNMKRTHELLERKTGGLVIWRSGSNIILYRGSDYKYPYFLTDELSNDSSSEESPNIDKDQRIVGKTDVQPPVTDAVESPRMNSGTHISHLPLIQGVGLPNRVRFQLPGEAELADEVDTLLEGLGPRFSDWWGCDPLPVDADLLPAVVPGYKRPFRLLPYGVKPKLTNDEMTTLRRLGRPLPCHFALDDFTCHDNLLETLQETCIGEAEIGSFKDWQLPLLSSGRNVKLPKIAIKRGVQNTNSELMAEELKVDQENSKNHYNKDKELRQDPESAHQSYFGDLANEARESHGTDDTSKDPEASMHTSKGSEDVAQQDSQGNVSLQSAVKGNYLFETTEEELQPRSLPQETKGLLSINEQSGRIGLSSKIRFQDRTSSSTTTCIQSHAGCRDSSIGGFQNAKLEPSLKKAMSETTPAMPFRALQLSNRERLLLRKQALKMKKLPVLSVGKSNVVTGVAKAIKAHFEKHPLAIVNIKGRAKGTSIREVIYNLEQATGAVLVSQEPSKVILYRGWGSGVEPDQASGKVNKDLKNDSDGGEVKARPHISPELISAIRLECGLKSQ